jgi:hypothetical protein
MVLPPILAFSMFSLAKTGILGGTTKYVDIGVINDHCRGILRRYIFSNGLRSKDHMIQHER